MRLACVQSPVVFGDAPANAAYAIDRLRELREKDVELAVFPEAFLTGYCVDTSEDACAVSLSYGIRNEVLRLLESECERLDMMAVLGYASRGDDGAVRNSAILFEPGVEPRVYHKTHLPFLGLDRFVEAGSELPVWDTRIGRIGVLICFDMRPPEASRVLALKGAELIVLPTNWPEGAEVSAEHVCIARAAENKVFYATCNRVGEENGVRFIGRSKIIGVSGRVLASAGAEEAVIVADIDLGEARNKRTVNIPGRYELDIIACRRPELYNA